MAIVRALKTGVWSDTTVWSTGALPTSADDVFSNTFTVTIDVSPTVLSISNVSTTGVTAGGVFIIGVNGITVSASNGFSAGSVTLITFSLLSPSSCTLSGNIVASNTPSGCIINNGTGTLNINGSIIVGALGNNQAAGILNSFSGTVVFTGNTVGGSSNINASGGCINSGSGTFNIVGNATQSLGNGAPVLNSSSGSITITGQVIGSAFGGGGLAAVRNTGIGSITITGNVTAGAAGAIIVENTSTGTIQVTGSATGSSIVATSFAINNSGSGTVTHIGSAFAGSAAPALAGSLTGVVYCSGPLIGTQSGISAITAGRWRWVPSVGSSYMTVPNSTATGYKNLFTADFAGSGSGQPAVANVRSGTVYGPSSELTGTCAVPGAASVAVGVPVDNTVGTAAITAASIRSAMGLASANLDTQLSPLPNLDATVSSRLATSGYTVPLTASDTRSALGLASANLDTQLAPLPNLDTTVSSRSTFNPATDTVANVTLVDTTTNLTNPPDVPTTAEIATAVANELEPALTNLDNDILSRLASVDYTVPPTAQQNAEAVEIQLALPLGNMDVAVSTRSTFNPTSDAVANVTLVDTTTNLTNPPVVPTTSEIATAVADTLDPTLTQINNDVLSRLATVNYTTPPTAEQNAEAVRVELSPELDRVANCATVATTGQQIQDALTPP